jgi:hypothetical protein
MCELKKSVCLRLARFLCIEFCHEHTAAFHKVVAVDIVEYQLALLATGNQLELLEDTQVVGDGRLGHIEGFHDIADALFPIEQYHQDLLASIVGQGPAKLDTVDSHTSLRE